MAVALRIGRTLTSLTYTSDPTDRATRLAAKCETVGGAPTYLGNARWPVSANASGTLTLIDPAGGHGPIGFDTQLADGNYYVYREKTAKLYPITASTESPNTVTITGDPGIAVGEFVQFRRGSSSGDPIAVGPSGPLSSFARSYIRPLLATAKSGDTLTVASVIAGLSDGLIDADDQYVGMDVALSNYVQTSTGDFTNSGGVDTWPVFVITQVGGTDFSGLAVGDWCISGTIGSSGQATSFPPLTVTAVNSSTEIEVEIRGKGPSFRQGSPSVELQFFRPVSGNETGVVTDSVAGTDAITIDDATGVTASPSAPAALELSYTPAIGKILYFLEHPTYVATSAPGIGVRFGSIDRQNYVAVPNLCPNAYLRDWTAGVPDGWAVVGSGATVTENTDSLYTQYGGHSAIVTLPTATMFRSPIIPWRPAYPGQRFSCRAHLIIPERWTGSTIRLEVRFGLMRSDGTLKTWRQPDAVEILVPPDSTASSGVRKIAGGVFDDVGLSGFDITSAAGLGDFTSVGAADLADAVGYFVAFYAATGGIPPFVVDAMMINQAPATPDTWSEFGEANKTWQDVNQFLYYSGPQQIEASMGFLDLLRMNPDLADDPPVKGALGLVNGPDLNVINAPVRITDVRRNLKKKGDTTITCAPRNKKFTALFRSALSATARVTSQIAAVQGATSGGGPSPAGGGGGVTSIPHIQLALEIDDSGIPTLTVVGENIASAKIATSIIDFPTADDVRAETAITSEPFVLVGSALSDGDTIKVAAFGYTADGIESFAATASGTFTAPAGSWATVKTITIDHTKVGSSDHTSFPLLFSGTFAYLKSQANGGEVRNTVGSIPADLWFTSDLAGTTKLDWEIVFWDPATGEIEAWVRVPSVSHTSDTSIFLAVGQSSETTDSSNPTGVWDANYSGVWHMGDGSSTNFADSTSNATTLSGVNTPTAATGKIKGGTQLTASSSQAITAASSTPIVATGSFTVSAWYKPSSFTDYRVLICKGNNGSRNYDLDTELTTGKLRFFFTQTAGFVGFTATTGLTTGNWHHCVATYDGTTMRVFLNGAADGTTAASGAPDTGLQGLAIGRMGDSLANYADGVIDEVRISKGIARSADWITAEYNNQNSPSTFYVVT